MTVSPQIQDALTELGLELHAGLGVRGAYAPTRQVGTMLWVSGVTGRSPAGPGVVGVVGEGVTVEQAREGARQAAVNLLAAIESTVGLHRVTALGHLRGYVRAVADFDRHPAVIDAASEVLVRALGPEIGAHARTALGVASLPGGAAVELDLVAHVTA
ncbi:RidA family protein [Sphaerisporangium perillae]|uniref:RidA family protein n=1 Tax=Sphaerisporangium perillae TaxID=2935860 RepID=UPI0020109F61|nr:RidA family protein [Sphaerisporangium perillae]